ncbi:hypothetical protein LA080_010438 [Diaporthe eres]|nr:hypothetical protein LA080_010438 [Diaporthe eres]
MSKRKARGEEEEELVSLPSGDEESEEDQRARSATSVKLSKRHALVWRKARSNAPPSRLLGPVKLVMHGSLAGNRAMTCIIGSPPLGVVARHIDQRNSVNGNHDVARVSIPGFFILRRSTPWARCVLQAYVSDEEDEDDYEDDEEQEEDDEAPAEDKAPPAKKAKTAPAQEDPEEEAEGEGDEDNEEPEEEFDEDAGGAEDDDDAAAVVGNGTEKEKAKVADAPEAAGEEEAEAVAGEGDEE